MKNSSFLLSFLLLIGITNAALSQSEKDYTEAQQLIEAWLESQKDFEKLPGITALVIDDQEVLWSGAFGMANTATQVEVQQSSLFSICSISKLFTSVAIMKLYDEEKLRLDDRISDLLPWYNLEQQFPESGPITIRSVLTHSAGLPRESKHAYWSGPDFPFPTSAEIKKELGTQKTLYPASTYFQYSNLGLTLLGAVITEVSGMPYEAYIQEHILTPLGLKDTRTYLPEDMHGQALTQGYSAMKREGDRTSIPLFDARGIAPAAGFSSNVTDLGKFAAWQLRLLDTTSTEILKPSTLKNMHRVHWTNPDWNLTWGLGFSVYKGDEGRTIVGHGGSCPGYRSALRIDPTKKRAYVVMINAGGTSPNKYIKGIEQILNKVGHGAKKDDPSTDFLKDYVGYYNMQPWWSEKYFSTWEGQLVSLNLPSDNPKKDMTFYQHVEGDVFKRVREDRTLGETLTFKRAENGKVYKIILHNNDYMTKIR